MTYLGSDILGIELDASISRFQCMVIVAIIGALITVAIQTYKVLLELKQKKKSILIPLLNLLPFLIFFSSSFLWCYQSEIALQLHPIISIVTISSTFTEIVSHIMLMHICDDSLKPLNRYSVYLSVLPFLHILSKKSNYPIYFFNISNYIEESNLIKLIFVFSIIFTVSRLYMVRKYPNQLHFIYFFLYFFIYLLIDLLIDLFIC